MQAMVERDAQYTLSGDVHVDDAYLGGELAGGKAGRGSENKVPFVVAISLSAEGRPLYIKMAPVPGFTRKAIVGWANADLSPGCIVTSDGLGCFAGITDAGCQHRAIIAGDRKPKDLPEFNWINTVLGNLKTSLGGLIMRSISPNTELATSARLFIGLTGASILRRFLCAYWS